MVQWRSISPEGMNDLWEELCGKMEEEVLEKCRVKEARKHAYKRRGEPPEWRIVKKKRIINLEML